MEDLFPRRVVVYQYTLEGIRNVSLDFCLKLMVQARFISKEEGGVQVLGRHKKYFFLDFF